MSFGQLLCRVVEIHARYPYHPRWAKRSWASARRTGRVVHVVPASRAMDLAACWRDIARDRREGRVAGFGWAERPRTLPPECDSTSEARSCSLGAQELPAWALLLLSLVSV